MKRISLVTYLESLLTLGETMSVWYPKFGLKEDPFGVYDYAIEEARAEGRYPRIKTKAVQKIVDKAISKTNVIFAGPKGSGKSTALMKASEEINKLGKYCFNFVGPKTLTDIYNQLWHEMSHPIMLDLNKDFDSPENVALRERQDKNEKNLHLCLMSNKNVLFWFSGSRCKDFDCRKREKCLFTRAESTNTITKGHYDREVMLRTGEEICRELSDRMDACPMKRRIVNDHFASVARERATGAVYLLDIPDDYVDLHPYDKAILAKLIEQFQTLGTVVITATDEQYASVRKSESLARIQKQDFPLPTNEELREIYVQRIKMSRMKKSELFPFTDNALNYLLDYSEKIPRNFIQLCSQVLTAMQSEGRHELADPDFILKILDLAPQTTETDAIKRLLGHLRAEGRDWVKVKELVKLLNGKYQVRVNDKRLGRRLKLEFNLDRRHNPDAEYKIRP
jgi:hypothetical protein